jgi:hypothetical protein
MENSLDDALDWVGDDAYKERFRVDDDAKALWAMRKYEILARKLAENESIANAEMQRIGEWLTKVNDKLRREQDFFHNLLAEYAVTEREANDRKTITTPIGSVSSRIVGGNAVVSDKDAFIEWAQTAAPELLRQKFEPAMSLINESVEKEVSSYFMKDTGEVVPGLTVSPSEVRVSIKIDGSDTDD